MEEDVDNTPNLHKMESIQATDGENKFYVSNGIQQHNEEPLTMDRENADNSEDKNNMENELEMINQEDKDFYNSFVYHSERLEFPIIIKDKLKFRVKLSEDMWNNITSF